MRIPLAEYDLQLAGELAMLTSGAQAAFAAACAERLYPAWSAYLAATGSTDDPVREALDLAWARLAGGQDAKDHQALFDRCEALLPGADELRSLPAHAEDAIYSALYLLGASTGADSPAASLVARHGTNSLDTFLLGAICHDDDEVWHHPLVRLELDRRAEDLATLRTMPIREAAASLRHRAIRVSVLPLDQLDHADLGSG